MVKIAFAWSVFATIEACNNPSACSGVCAMCKGQCETLKTGFPCGQCWAVDPSYGTSCLSDRPEQPDDCRSCWHPDVPSPPSPPTPPTPAPTPPIRPNPFSKECLAELDTLCGKFTPHGNKTNPTNCNGCIGYHPKEIVPLCGGWQPAEGGPEDFQAWCEDKYVPPTPTPPVPVPAPSPVPSPVPTPGPPSPSPTGCPGGSLEACIALCPTDVPAVFTACVEVCGQKCEGPTPSPAPTPVPSPAPTPVPSPVPTPVPIIPGGCNDPTGACFDQCATCQGTCETLKTGPCAACWAVDPTFGHACLSDDEGDHGDCRNCWHTTGAPTLI